MYETSHHLTEICETDQARAQEYALLAALLARSPDSEMLRRLAALSPDTSLLGRAHQALAQAAARTSADDARREYFDLFSGLGDGGLLPYASHYVEGALYGRPLARLRKTLDRLGVERAEGCLDPEDHAATLCAVMAGLAGGEIAAPVATHQKFFEQQLAPWIGRFFADLEKSAAASFYARVATVGRTFIEIEITACGLGS